MLIERMDLLARTRPAMFRWRVQATLALGYGFLAGLLGMAVLVCVAAFYPLFVRDAMFKILVGVLAAIFAVGALIVAVRKAPHLSGVHARWMVRAAHLERTARSLRAALESSRRGAGRALRRACEWYLERLHACALPASRAGEYEADRTAARLTSPSKLAEALAILAVGERFWRQRYWPRVYADIRHAPHPVRFPHTSFGMLWLNTLGTEQARAWLDAALLSKTACAHLSPALSDRIRALGADPVLALAEHETADRLLGAERARLDALFDNRWREAVAERWRRIYQAIHAPAPPMGAV